MGGVPAHFHWFDLTYGDLRTATEQATSGAPASASLELRRFRGHPSPGPRFAPYCRHACPPKIQPRAEVQSLAARTCSRSTSISPSCSIPPWRSRTAAGFGEAPQPKFEAPAPESHPRGLTGAAVSAEFAESAARRGRPQHPQPPAVGSAPPAAAGQVRRRAALSRRLRVRAAGRPAAGDRGIGQGRALT